MGIEAERKRLLWRATHRGTRELDLMLGGFAKSNVDAMDESEIAELLEIIEIPDDELMSWILGQVEVPDRHRSGTLTRLLSFRP